MEYHSSLIRGAVAAANEHNLLLDRKHPCLSDVFVYRDLPPAAFDSRAQGVKILGKDRCCLDLRYTYSGFT